MKRKDKALARAELRHRHLPWKLLRFWEIIIDVVFQSFISTDTFIFKVGNKSTIIASVDVFIIISGHYALALTSEIFAGISFTKIKVFTINRKELRPVVPWKFERLISYFSRFSDWVASENIPANIFLQLRRSLFSIKPHVFNLNCSGSVCFYFQAVMEYVLVNLQPFAINGSDGVCNGACFNCHVFVVCV